METFPVNSRESASSVPTLNFHTWSEDERGQPLKNHGDGGACARLNARSLKAIDILRHGNVARRSTRVEKREKERERRIPEQGGKQTPRKLIMYDWRGIARDSRRRLTPRYVDHFADENRVSSPTTALARPRYPPLYIFVGQSITSRQPFRGPRLTRRRLCYFQFR